jgi:hypothetical protein
MTKERLAEIRGEVSSCHDLKERECRELLGSIEQLLADKQRMADEIYKLTDAINKAKAAFENPGERYNDEATAIAMMEALDGKVGDK